MANSSILAAFERMWQHVVTALSGKADVSAIPTKTSQLTNDSGFKTTDNNSYHTPSSTSGIKIATGIGVADMYVPTGTSSSTVAVGNHTHSSYANQNAFSNIKVGSTTVAADTTTDTVELVAGTNITLTPDATNDKITIAATGGTDTNYYHTPSSTSGIKIATGTGVSDLYVPTGTSSSTVSRGDHTHSGYAPAYSYGTYDLDPDEDELTTGKLYFMYE